MTINILKHRVNIFTSMINRIIFSYGEDEHLPIISEVGSNLKEKNLFYFESINTVKNGDYKINRYAILTERKKMDMFLTYTDDKFIRGFLYVDGKEYAISEYKVYMSLQIEDYCYDGIAGIRLPNDFSMS
jgi:hypothetical protein